MKRHYVTDPVVRAIDRASQDQYRLQAFMEAVEQAILADKDTIREACPLEGGSNAMARTLLHYLQESAGSDQPWVRSALGSILELLDLKKLASQIWPEAKRQRTKSTEPASED